MKEAKKQTLVRIFLEESYKFRGKPAYQMLLEYLRAHDYAGATVLRGVEGFGRKHKIHTAEMLELSTDLPVVIEIVEEDEQVERLKEVLERSGIVNGALVTEEKVTAYRFGG